KIRNRLQDMDEDIFVQSDDRNRDGFKSLRERADSYPELKAVNKGKSTDKDRFAAIACEKWIDVRSFGQVFAFSGGISVGVRGPVSLQAVSLSPIQVFNMQIVKSVNSESKEGSEKSSDTMGMKHLVPFGLYLLKGSINCQLAEKTGFSDEDAEKIKKAILTLFENDASAARPDGSMEVCRLYWWQHNCKEGQYSSATVHRSVRVTPKDGVVTPGDLTDYNISVQPLDGLACEEIYGI
ncbi:MAG: type I-C CRISPR-associated protein Cas7/Csd2, partial [Bacillota bacterium]|nr:type I-C CRISPR-associated protein Cas7/Csd2 [Bacillota bacterium]